MSNIKEEMVIVYSDISEYISITRNLLMLM